MPRSILNTPSSGAASSNTQPVTVVTGAEESIQGISIDGTTYKLPDSTGVGNNTAFVGEVQSTEGPEYTIEDITENSTVTGVRLQGKVVVQSDPSNINSDLTTTIQVPTDTSVPSGTGQEGEVRVVGSADADGRSRLFVCKNSAWVDVGAAHVGGSANEPSNPASGTLWYDTDVSELKVRSESNWVVAGAGVGYNLQFRGIVKGERAPLNQFQFINLSGRTSNGKDANNVQINNFLHVVTESGADPIDFKHYWMRTFSLPSGIGLHNLVFKDVDGNQVTPTFGTQTISDSDKTTLAVPGNESLVTETHFPALDYKEDVAIRAASDNFRLYISGGEKDTVNSTCEVEEILYFSGAQFMEGFMTGTALPEQLFSESGYVAGNGYVGGLMIHLRNTTTNDSKVLLTWGISNNASSNLLWMNNGDSGANNMSLQAAYLPAAPEYSIEDVVENNIVTGVRLQGKVVVQSDPTNLDSDVTTTLQVPTSTAVPTETTGGYEGEIRLVNDGDTLKLYAWYSSSTAWKSVTFA